MGRLLNKSIPLVRVEKDELRHFHPKQLKYLRANNLASIYYRGMLNKYGVNRIEYSALKQGIGINMRKHGLKGSLYYPWIYCSSTRICEYGSFSLPNQRKFHVGNRCKKECEKIYMTLTLKGQNRETYFQIGNVLAAVCRDDVEGLIKTMGKSFDRLVLCPYLPN